MSVSGQVITVINARLHELFPTVTVYNDSTRMGTHEPCFLFRILSQSPTSRLGERRWLTRFGIEITYLETGVTQQRIQDVRETLLFSLNDWETIIPGWYMRAVDPSTTVLMEEDALVYTAAFLVPMYQETPKMEPMIDVTLNTYIDHIPDLPDLPEDKREWKEIRKEAEAERDENKNGVPDPIDPTLPGKSEEEKQREETGYMAHLKQFGRIL